MKTKILLLCAAAFFVSMSSQGQFWKKVAKKASKAAEDTVLDKVGEKTSRKTGKTMDTIFDGSKKSRKNRKGRGQSGNNGGTNQNTNQGNTSGNGTARSAKDFVPGNKVLYSDSFKNDAIGDFPVTWNTNASAEVVTFDGDDQRWLSLSNNGVYTPDGITNIPENSTLEFDLYVTNDYSFYSSGMLITIIEAKDKRRDFMKWSGSRHGNNGVRLWLHPTVAGSSKSIGRTGISSFVNGESMIQNAKNNEQFTLSGNTVHVSIWRQKSRLRIYLNDQKIWDLPRAFDNINYNSIVFSAGKGASYPEFYITNLRLAVAGEDKRHALLETGEFETNEILFDTGKASIQESSFSILNEIGQVLQENENLKINIIGHTDSDGTTDGNQTLSEARAKSVKEYLTDNYPIMGNRLKTEGKGASNPIASNDTSDGKRKNRRVQFIKID